MNIHLIAVRKLLLIVFIIVGAIYFYLVAAVEDDIRWFQSYSQSFKTNTANNEFDSLQYSAYRWRINQKTLNWEFYLAYYIKVRNDGSYLAMRHSTTPEVAMYYKGYIDKSLHILLDSLEIVPLDTLYIKPEPRIYDGNTFKLNFVASKESNIDFYQSDAPSYLLRVATALDNVIFTSDKSTDQFDLSFHEEGLKKQSIQRLGRLPKIEVPKFK